MNTEIFEQIGFSRGEVKVYFALLELGESTIGPLSKKSGVTAAKTYPILDKLAKKGLITNTIKSGTSYFQAFNPNRILHYVEEKRKNIYAQEQEIKKIIPHLIAKQKTEATQAAMVYEGYNGLKTLFNEAIELLEKTEEDFIAFTLGEEYEDPLLMGFFEQYDAKRKAKGIQTRLIGLEGQRNRFTKEYTKESGLSIRFLPYASLPKGVIIFGDKVATMVWSENPAAFVIQSKTTAEAYKKFFWDLWSKAKP